MSVYDKRLKTFTKGLKQRSLDSFLVSNEINVSYLSGFKGNDSLILVTPDANLFITDSRYVEEARDSLRGLKIEMVTASTYETLKASVQRLRLKRFGFESMNLPYEVVQKLKHYLGHTKIFPTKNIIESQRAIKDEDEIGRIKRSVRVTKTVLNAITASLKPGVSEKCLSQKAEIEFLRHGGHTSFQPIVALGKNSSKPHAHPTAAKVKSNSFIMVDIGCNVDGYNSDITRMVVLGKISDAVKKMYVTVRTAQGKAIEKIRPGARISDIDFVARQYIREKGFGKYFGHSLGHGVGMEVHEEPSISRTNQDLLKTGMVFTVEPGIYIPGLGGVRIEDMVLVTDTGYNLLTR